MGVHVGISSYVYAMIFMLLMPGLYGGCGNFLLLFFCACVGVRVGVFFQVWYLIPSSRASKVERMLQSYVALEPAEHVLHSLTVQLSPSLFLENRIPLYRVEQKENEFLMLWPRTYHAGFNLG